MGDTDVVSECEDDGESSFSVTPNTNTQLIFKLKYSQMRKEFGIWL